MTSTCFVRRTAVALSSALHQIQISGVRNVTFSSTGSVMPKPEPAKPISLIGVTVAVGIGVSLGAYISKNIASFLEENELFIPSDDDDDDD